MDLGLLGRVAVVTGSSKGIGRAIASSLAEEHVKIVLNARGREALAESANQLRGRGAEVREVASDVTTPEGCDLLVREAMDAFGRVDILVNNVGGGPASGLDATEEEWHQGLDLCVWSSLRLTQRVAPGMRQRRSGVVIMVASIYGRERGGRAGYQVAKSAEISLANTLARELAPDGIRVLSVAPGSIMFPGGPWWRRREADPAAMAAFVERDMPLGRFGRSEEVGDVVAFLCSDRASLVTGVCLPVDGCQGRSII